MVDCLGVGPAIGFTQQPREIQKSVSVCLSPSRFFFLSLSLSLESHWARGRLPLSRCLAYSVWSSIDKKMEMQDHGRYNIKESFGGRDEG